MLEQKERPARRGLVDRVAAAYWNFSGAAKSVIAERPSDATLLSFLVIAGFLGLIGVAFELFAALPPGDPEAAQAVQRRIGEAFIGRLILFPLAALLFAALIARIARRAGGTGGDYETRAAVAWSMIVAAPALFAATAATAALIALGADPGLRLAPEAPPLQPIKTAAGFLAAYILSAGVAGAHGFASPLRVMLIGLAGIALLAGLAALVALAL